MTKGNANLCQTSFDSLKKAILYDMEAYKPLLHQHIRHKLNQWIWGRNWITEMQHFILRPGDIYFEISPSVKRVIGNWSYRKLSETGRAE